MFIYLFVPIYVYHSKTIWFMLMKLDKVITNINNQNIEDILYPTNESFPLK